MDRTALIQISADPRCANPTTLRHVLQEHDISNTRDDESLTFFLECVTVRDLLRAEEYARAELCARQMGTDISQFGDALETLACQIAACNNGQDWRCTLDPTHVVATYLPTGERVRVRTAEEFALIVEAWAQRSYCN